MFRVKRLVLFGLLVGATIGSAASYGGSGEVFAKAKDKLVLITGKRSAGSGFVLSMEEGKKYLVTNKHVVKGEEAVLATTLNGKILKLGDFSVAANDVDLVRFLLPAETPSLNGAEETPNIGESVFVYGNSDGQGVATDLSGKIVGVGPKLLEVDVPFVHGNSGSAVLNGEGNVVGVATFATYDANPEDWMKQGSRFANVRRFAIRIIDVSWVSMTYASFVKQVADEQGRELENTNKAVPQIKARFSPCKLPVKKGKSWYDKDRNFRRDAVVSDISLGFERIVKDRVSIKTPCVRVVVLFEGTQHGRIVSDCVLDMVEVPAGRVARTGPPIYTYDMKSTGFRWDIGNNRYVYYLEGLSYWQKPIADGTRKLNYFKRGPTTRSDAEQNSIMPAYGKVVAFRLECWQNGALAGVYDSKGLTELKTRKIPFDWYIIGKYPDMFEYGKAAKYSE